MRLFVSGRAILTALALCCGSVGSGCGRETEGVVPVVVVGDPPQLVDPSTRPLDAGDAVLLSNVAQGLVRFDARGQIEPGLAERWNVSDDGLSYIFRLSPLAWPDGGRITAHQVARHLRRQLTERSRNQLKDTLGAVDEIVAMTDRVLEIRLRAPRPNLLQLLAQPEMSVIRNGQGSGPFAVAERQEDGPWLLRRSVPGPDGEEATRESLLLSGLPATQAIAAFAEGKAALVLGGTFDDLPLVPRKAQGGDLLFDPVAGLFGLAPTRNEDALADPEVRRLLSEAIDRESLIAAMNVPGLVPRATLLEGALEGLPEPVAPLWLGAPLGERRPDLIARADRLFGSDERPTLRIAAPAGPGGELLLRRLAEDWALIGIRVERARSASAAELELIDLVAPSTSPAWFLRRFRCAAAAICDEEIDRLLDAARTAPVAAQRGALFAEAARRADELQLFIPITAPIRWSLVSDRIEGLAGNRFGRHSLIGLAQRLEPERAQ